MFRLFTTLFLLGAAQILLAQSDLFIPRNIQRAYTKGTRSADGQPGAKYWQNRSNYDIQVQLEPKKRRLSGSATITYTNNSPDSLKMIRLKLAHDLYRKGGLRQSEVNPDDIDDGVIIEALSYNGIPVPEDKQRRRNTFLDIQLGTNVLRSKATGTISVRWSYTLPSDPGATRECVCDASTFFVPYWYPQVAVYDDCQGWADAPYNGEQEFYNDFADYNVRITMPKGYMVWATGEWQNPEELLTDTYLQRFRQAHTAAEVVPIFTEAELKTGTVFKKAKQHVFRYTASEVPDFTFAASDHYNWDARSVVVDDRSGRRTFVSAAYLTQSKDFTQVARIAAEGIRLMSTWLPGYPFPYPSMTVFNGNDGMEYPMMVNDASVSESAVASLTLHEVSHTYFPFMMGINEQDYAWMDEGWASFFDFNLADSLTGDKTGTVRGYSGVAGTDADVPPMVRSRYLSGRAYGNASYGRPQNAYLGLLDLLGYDTFHRCMVTYMDRWKGKHPTPYDFFNTWNEVSGQNLDWYWKPWFFEWGYPDLDIQSVSHTEGGDADVVYVVKKGNVPVPVYLELSYADGTKDILRQSAAVWKDGKTVLEMRGRPGKNIVGATLGERTIPDSIRKNNTWKKD
ncbi:MAG: M1 family metallopeptidase [Saprospiraceae bacterium]|nr:M1 family metallopeptidase [Saprospiraceae bacterium]